MKLVPLDRLSLQAAIQSERDPVTAEFAARDAYAHQVMTGPAFAAMDGDQLVAAGGLITHWCGRAEAWSLVSKHARPRQVVGAIRLARAVLDEHQKDLLYRRIEMFVRYDCDWAHDFARALGFIQEGLLEAWDPLGRDMWLFARVARRGIR